MDNTEHENKQETNQETSQEAKKDTFQEEFKVTGDRVIGKVKELIREGNVRRIIIKNEESKTLLEIPLTIGVVGTLLLPVWAALGALAALVANLTIGVERRVGAEPTNNDVTPTTTAQED
ncbi:MAG: DUF4342 domain-containing protein [Trueperaceae bacterium]